MGNCWTTSLQSSGNHLNSNTAPNTNNQPDNNFRLSAGFSNLRLIRNDNSTSLGRSSNSGGNSKLFSSNNHSTGNNTSTSFWGSENSQTTRARDEEFPYGQILDAANLKVFTLVELKAATRNFRPDTLLGEGGFGRVYKGLFKESAASKRGEGLTIAIKKLNSDSRQGVAEWQFTPAGGSTVQPLSWDGRLKVMIGAARGLNFLHSLEKKIIYRDFKPSNILLDKAYTAKLSDFGLARSVPSDDHTHVSTQVVGTCGYAAPEYIATGFDKPAASRHTRPNCQTLAWPDLFLLMITLTYQHRLWEHVAMPPQSTLPQALIMYQPIIDKMVVLVKQLKESSLMVRQSVKNTEKILDSTEQAIEQCIAWQAQAVFLLACAAGNIIVQGKSRTKDLNGELLDYKSSILRRSSQLQHKQSISNLRLVRNGNSASLGRSSNSGGNSTLFSSNNNHSTGNNTSTSFWDSENSQASRVRDEEEFPYGHILDAANLKVFTWAELKSATRNFRPENLLGEGGFGKVFKGLIKEGAESKKGEVLTIAIKILDSHSTQGFAEWQAYTAKLSDFGLAKSGPSDDHTHVSTRVVGTGGYAAPEYMRTGHLYVKSDVYGFGLVLMEILTDNCLHSKDLMAKDASQHFWILGEA
ncbi:hypothetical protein TSUD_205610 [Trifolium subterraneum]|uniref:non-specific serine/threonine protein kinase n=1 Tax=Trifolium subterraneum TaxID=3900 RepID=A0A2Z6MR60_TRISU|nr:hypothetical protein TSUD_205610 [Trifolium subterraneum]